MSHVVGNLVATAGVVRLLLDDTGNAVPEKTDELLECLLRFIKRDWGDVCEDDWKANDDAIDNDERLLAAYTLQGEKIWVITEWDRSVTTILLPSEY